LIPAGVLNSNIWGMPMVGADICAFSNVKLLILLMYHAAAAAAAGVVNSNI
jgi:alpha-glucosidase (family GH31 glycosyl hydrolase)